MRPYFALIAVMLLTACAKPVTQAPKINQGLLEQERAAQQAALDAQNGNQKIKLLSADEINARMARVTPRIQQEGEKVCEYLHNTSKGCTYPFEVVNDNVLNAWADGRKVYITPAMVSFAANDEELAVVLAHEYAHNILNHPQGAARNAAVGGIAGILADRLAASQGYEVGDTFQKLGTDYGAYKYSVPFEQEADYVGIYIMGRAGYNIQGMENFWRKFTLYSPNGLYTSLTHPSNPQRVVAIQSTVTEIERKQQAQQPLLPERKAR